MPRAGEFNPEAKELSAKLCTVGDCTKPLRARGMCCMHWARWRKYGTPEPWAELCAVDGCDNKSRSRTSEYCEKHYYRLRRTGSLSDPQYISGECLADGCGRPAGHGKESEDARGYCRMHYLRLKKRGDVCWEPKGENNPIWVGAAAGSTTVHQRIRRARGSATNYRCIDCGETAAHWSYDHTDPDQKYCPDKGPYSLDIDRYHPRCVSCHKRFDMRRIKAERSK
ncbi:Uncharacterised protein [Mycobacteroides abscessus subsp. abscessus]|nr:Uncharacterised protein [Mycobacteroides abscessus subsp. abscessus]SID55648.1 Uncharacterised protein [Mycobacteroides abscessus subsp. abscessus]SKO44192.1 Uncharacterised protein [Mycobacteroides abscessus subsp. abscessus]